MRWRAPTLNQVAALAGVSHQTVSRVLNRHANVSANTRARVLAAIHQLDYQPNTAARTLVTGRSQTIGLITFDGTLAGTARSAASAGRSLIMIMSRSWPVFSGRFRGRRLIRPVRRQRVSSRRSSPRPWTNSDW